MNPRPRTAKKASEQSRPKSARTVSEQRRMVKMTNHILSLDPELETPVPQTSRKRVNPQTSHTMRRKAVNPVMTEEEDEQEHCVNRPPHSARQPPLRMKSTCQKPQSKAISKVEIENIKRVINATRPRTIMWGDSTPGMISERIKADVSTPRTETRRHTIIINSDPIDLSNPVPAAKLISTKALVQDFIGVPNSLSFIR